ncbi:hypothetical protein VB735_23835 [Halotia wernerae UHCC 0503]|nr:hypothetical protein [Halotia wernerae UHCC 0503]
MNESVQALPLLVLLVGMAIAIAILIKSSLERIGVPALVGYLVLGCFLRQLLCNEVCHWGIGQFLNRYLRQDHHVCCD